MTYRFDFSQIFSKQRHLNGTCLKALLAQGEGLPLCRSPENAKSKGGPLRVTLGGRARRRGTAWPIKLRRALRKDQGSQDLDRRLKNTHWKLARSGPVGGTSAFGENQKMAENTFSGLAHARGGRLPEFFFWPVATIPTSALSLTLAQEARWIVLEAHFRKLSGNFPEALFRDCARARGRWR